MVQKDKYLKKIDKLIIAAEDALKQGLEVWLSPTVYLKISIYYLWIKYWPPVTAHHSPNIISNSFSFNHLVLPPLILSLKVENYS